MREILDYIPLPEGGAALARVYGDSPVLALPEALPGPEGGALPLVKLGGYCFAETVRDQHRGPLLRCVREEGGALRPIAPEQAPQEDLHPAAGRFLEEVALPAALREVGNCTFYNCRALRRITAGGGPLAMGSDVFLNCFDLAEVVLYASPDAATGLPAIVNNLAGNLRAVFRPKGRRGRCAPPSAIPNTGRTSRRPPPTSCCTPFRGRGTITASASGTGGCCPGSTTPCLPRATAGTTPPTWPCSVWTGCAIPGSWRRGPRGSTGRSWPGRGSVAAECLIRAQDREGLKALLGLGVMDGSALAAASRAAQRAGDAQAAALLADAEYQAQAAAPRHRRRYDFDF